MRWSCCKIDDATNLTGYIENDPLTVYGDFLVFPVAGIVLEDDATVLPVAKLVTMPTQGVYSEGILGQCNTCGIVNKDTFWDWQTSLCEDMAPDIVAEATPMNARASDNMC